MAVSAVGERALAAVRHGGGYHIYHSQWAGSDRLLAQVLGVPAGDQFDALCSADWACRGVLSPADALENIDTLSIEAVFVVSVRGVTVYQPVWLGFSTPDGTVAGATDGVLVRVETTDGRRRLRALVQFLKGMLYRAIGCDLMTESHASALLALVLVEYCTPGRICAARPADILERVR